MFNVTHHISLMASSLYCLESIDDLFVSGVYIGLHCRVQLPSAKATNLNRIEEPEERARGGLVVLWPVGTKP